MAQLENTECAAMYRDFFQKLASTLMVDSDGVVLGFNVTFTAPDEACDCVPAITCDLNHIDPIQFAAMHGFGLDACGRLALKLTACEGSIAGPEEEGGPN